MLELIHNSSLVGKGKGQRVMTPIGNGDKSNTTLISRKTMTGII